jgi:hypothetical protein
MLTEEIASTGSAVTRGRPPMGATVAVAGIARASERVSKTLDTVLDTVLLFSVIHSALIFEVASFSHDTICSSPSAVEYPWFRALNYLPSPHVYRQFP